MSSTKICKLSEVITIQNGYAFASKKFTAEEGMPLIRIRDLKNGITTQTKYSGEFDEAYLVKSGDLLIGMDGEFKCYEWKGSPALLNQRVCRIQNINETFDLKYLYYGINSYLKAIEDVTGYTTVKHLSSSTILDIEFPIPSLEKQREIVEKLDSAFVEIEEAKIKTSLTVENLSRLLDSKFEEVFKLMEALHGMIQSGVVIDVRDGTHDSPGYVDSGYPLVTSKNLQDGLIDFSKVSFIKKEDYQQINKRSKVEAGDLLFAMIGTIGNPVVVKEEPLFAIKNVALFKGNPKYDMNFLSYYLRSSKIKEKFEREAKGTTQRFLGLGYLRTLEIPNVPIHDQLEIVRELEQFESESKKLELNLKSRLKSLIELNNSILSSFFTSDSDEKVVA
jgi:type I restriction enzyme, S subunit